MKKIVVCSLLVLLVAGFAVAAAELLNPPVKTTGYYKSAGSGSDVVAFRNDSDGNLKADWSCWWPDGGIYMWVETFTWNGIEVGPGYDFESDGPGTTVLTVIPLEGNPATKIRVVFSDGTTLDMTWHAGNP